MNGWQTADRWLVAVMLAMILATLVLLLVLPRADVYHWRGNSGCYAYPYDS